MEVSHPDAGCSCYPPLLSSRFLKVRYCGSAVVAAKIWQ